VKQPSRACVAEEETAPARLRRTRYGRLPGHANPTQHNAARSLSPSLSPRLSLARATTTGSRGRGTPRSRSPEMESSGSWDAIVWNQIEVRTPPAPHVLLHLAHRSPPSTYRLSSARELGPGRVPIPARRPGPPPRRERASRSSSPRTPDKRVGLGSGPRL
jgi:hypothetical protein